MVTDFFLSTDFTDDTVFLLRGAIASVTRDYLFHLWDPLIFFSQPMIRIKLMRHALCLCSSGVLVFRPRMARMVTNLLSTDDTDDTDFARAVLVLLRGACFLPTNGTNSHESFVN